LEIEVESQTGDRAVRLRVDNDNIRFDLAGVEIAGVDCLAGVWHNYKLVINCETQSYDFYLDGKLERENIEFGFKTESVSRIVFRTGPYRNLVPNDYIDGYPNAVGMFGEDLPAAGRKVTPIIYWIDDFKTMGN
jgi:hypothetical protein